MEIVELQNCNPSNWSGGTTTELVIFPKGSSYKERNFDCRISIATVEKYNSIYTPLSGFERTVLVLSGNLILDWDNGRREHLVRGKSIQFAGSQETVCIGLATNFNIMTSRKLKCQELSIHENISEHVISEKQIFFVFTESTSIQISTQNQAFTLHKEKLFHVRGPQKISITTIQGKTYVAGLINVLS